MIATEIENLNNLWMLLKKEYKFEVNKHILSSLYNITEEELAIMMLTEKPIYFTRFSIDKFIIVDLEKTLPYQYMFEQLEDVIKNKIKTKVTAYSDKIYFYKKIDMKELYVYKKFGRNLKIEIFLGYHNYKHYTGIVSIEEVFDSYLFLINARLATLIKSNTL